MSIVYADEQDLTSERGWERRVVPIDAMGLLQRKAKFLWIKGESRARIEVFLITAEYGIQRPYVVVADASDLPSLTPRIRHAYDFGSVKGDPCGAI